MKHNNQQLLLARLRLYIDPSLLQKVFQLAHHPQEQGLQSPLDSLDLYAMAGIVIQHECLLSVDSKARAAVGLSLERLVMQVPPVERTLLIDKVLNASREWKGSSPQLRAQVKSVCRAYRQMEKAKMVVIRLEEDLALDEMLHENLAEDHFKAVWLLYISLKQKAEKCNFKYEDEHLIIATIYSFYASYPFRLARPIVLSLLTKFYNSETTLKGMYLPLKGLQIENIVEDVLKIRNQRRFANSMHQKLFDQEFTSRFVDDFYNKVQQQIYSCQNHQVNQALFLAVDKTLTPMPRVSQWVQNEEKGCINRKINLLDDSEEEQQCEESFFLSCKSKASKSESKQGFVEEEEFLIQEVKKDQNEMEIEEVQKVQSVYMLSSEGSSFSVSSLNRLSNLNWLNRVTKPSSKADFRKFQLQCSFIFEDPFEDMKERYSRIVQKYLLQQATIPLDVELRSKKVINLFIFLMKNFTDEDAFQHAKKILHTNSQVHVFMWISLLIVCYCHKNPEVQQEQSMKLFGVDPYSAFFPINWVGTRLSLPTNIKEFMISIEKHLLLVSIWKHNEGYQLIQSKKRTYYDMSLYCRMVKQISYRVVELVKGEEFLADRVIKQVNEIIKDKSELLKHNTMSMVVLLAYGAKLKKKNTTAEVDKIIAKWKQMPRFFQEQIIVKDQDGMGISFQELLLKYYPKIDNFKPLFQTTDKRVPIGARQAFWKVKETSEAPKSSEEPLKSLIRPCKTKLTMGDSSFSFEEAKQISHNMAESSLISERIWKRVNKGIEDLSIEE